MYSFKKISLLDALYGRLPRMCEGKLLAELDSTLGPGDFSDDVGEGRLGEGPPKGHGGSLRLWGGEPRGGSIGGGCLNIVDSTWPHEEDFSMGERLKQTKKFAYPVQVWDSMCSP